MLDIELIYYIVEPYNIILNDKYAMMLKNIRKQVIFTLCSKIIFMAHN